jgi:DNA-binding transcriptional ArsR family regulator
MPDQLDLFVHPARMARSSDPVTSHEAAADAKVNARTHRASALRLLREHPAGLTDFELADLTGLQQTSIGKRRGELRDAGLVINSGRKRPAPSGSLSIVWQALPDAEPAR